MLRDSLSPSLRGEGQGEGRPHSNPVVSLLNHGSVFAARPSTQLRTRLEWAQDEGESEACGSIEDGTTRASPRQLQDLHHARFLLIGRGLTCTGW